MVSAILSDDGLDLLFRNARTHRAWLDRPISDVLLQAVYEAARLGPTSANCSPMRILFVRSPEAKERLKPALDPGNVAQTMAAPVTAIIGYDLGFYDHLARLYPQADARSWFANSPQLAATTAFRNGSLQGAYFIIAGRALGLDCGPMSGFDNAKVDATFFPDGRVKSNFLCNLGYGDAAQLAPRNPRLTFDEACGIL
jgi:3-hydroxypropanoate dehydrogenase